LFGIAGCRFLNACADYCQRDYNKKQEQTDFTEKYLRFSAERESRHKFHSPFNFAGVKVFNFSVMMKLKNKIIPLKVPQAAHCVMSGLQG